MNREWSNTHSLLKSGEENGERTLLFAGTECGHGDVGDGRNHKDAGDARQKHCHEKVF